MHSLTHSLYVISALHTVEFNLCNYRMVVIINFTFFIATIKIFAECAVDKNIIYRLLKKIFISHFNYKISYSVIYMLNNR